MFRLIWLISLVTFSSSSIAQSFAPANRVFQGDAILYTSEMIQEDQENPTIGYLFIGKLGYNLQIVKNELTATPSRLALGNITEWVVALLQNKWSPDILDKLQSEPSEIGKEAIEIMETEYGREQIDDKGFVQVQFDKVNDGSIKAYVYLVDGILKQSQKVE